uniref:TFIIS-type domain-containing protein n=1 Tax=viral metagenome TaxID=1070528 RepID=A0A6C0E7N8_9ZZZZ
MTELSYDAWIFLQDGTTTGLSLKPLPSNLRESPIEKLITYKSFIKLIPNTGQEFSDKSQFKLKLLSDWSVSGEYYQLYGWISGDTSKINMHNFLIDDYPDQDFYGDIILFKIDPLGHNCQPIIGDDLNNIDLAKKDDEYNDDDEQIEEEIINDDDDDEIEQQEKPIPDEINDGEEDEDEEDEEDEEYQYDDDAGGDEFEDEANLYQDYDDDDEFDLDDRTSKRKKKAQKIHHCCFSRLVSADILKAETTSSSSVENLSEKRQKIYFIFQELLFQKKKLTPNNIKLLLDLERGIYNWTIKNGQNTGFLCLWDDRLFSGLYERKAISIYQNFSPKFNNQALQRDLLNGKIDPYQVSFMSSDDLHPEHHLELREQLKKKEKVQFEKRKTIGSTQYKCGKCGQRDVSIATAQTRSADEGITLFVSCNNCPNEWKMGG